MTEQIIFNHDTNRLERYADETSYVFELAFKYGMTVWETNVLLSMVNKG